MSEGSAKLTESDWQLIVRRVRDGRCVPFLGAGASVGDGDKRGLPSARKLSSELAVECNYPGADRDDLLRVAQYYTMVFDPYEVRASIRRKLMANDAKPGVVHRTLAKLPLPFVITTNFDDLMERAFQAEQRAPTVAVYEPHGNRQKLEQPTVQKPLVYKLHGSVTEPRTMIATEDDVIEFLACLLIGDPGMPPLIKQLFEDYSILFIGYGLRDWNIRVMLRALRGRRLTAHSELSCFAIQRKPAEPALAAEWEKAVIYWSKHESLRCFDMDAIAFVTELYERFTRDTEQ